MKNSTAKINQPVRGRVAAVPVVMQMDVEESGAASLCSVLAYYGRWIPLAQARLDCGISRDGSKIENIVRAAEKHGMRAEAKAGDLSALREASFPCVVRWKDGRFAVVCGFARRGMVMVNDPERGALRLREDEFARFYESEYVALAPGENFVPEGQQEGMFSYVAKRLRGSWSELMFVMLSALTVALAGIMLPVFQRVLTDCMLTGMYGAWTKPFLLLFAAVGVGEVAALAIREKHLLKLRAKMSLVSNTTFFWHVLHMPMEFFFQRTAGDLLKATPHRTAARQAMSFPPSALANLLTCNQQACEICKHI